MAFNPIEKIEGLNPVLDESSWIAQYKEAFVEHHHDTSQVTLVHPDDCLVVFGPPRLAHTDESDTFQPVGFLNGINFTETRQVNPLKALGTRRHIFSATNSPVQGSIERLFLLGRNALNSMYARAQFGADITSRNSKYSTNRDSNALWYTNVEEDIFRIPFGMGIVYHAPATLAGGSTYVAGAEYFEVCTIVSKSVSLQSGQSMVMEQVAFMADRVVAWDAGHATLTPAQANTAVSSSSNMGGTGGASNIQG